MNVEHRTLNVELMEIEELPESGTSLRKHTVFAHVLMKNAELYRAILEVFVRSREQFITHMRPAEVALSIGRNEEETENALRQLRLWGNLEATQDDAEQTSLEEFYRVHLLYALSSPGEAAERALAVFEETMHQPGELQTTALRDITEFLEAMRILLESAEVDVAKLHTQLLTLTERFRTRVTRSDRFTDWQTLALWFAEAPEEEDTHKLWRAAFGLAPARHLQINEETLDRRDQSTEGPRTPWMEAEPVWISPRLHVNGRVTVRSQATAVVDQSKAKNDLARLEADEAEQIARAQRELARGQPIRLSDFEVLEPATFQLLLDLLGEALSVRTDPQESVDAVSMDGALIIRLGAADAAAPLAEIVTSTGVLRGPDCEVTILYAHDALGIEASEIALFQES